MERLALGALVVHDDRLRRIDDQVVPDRVHAEIAHELGRHVALVRRGRDHLDDDHRLRGGDRVRGEAFAALHQHVRLVGRAVIDLDGETVGKHLTACSAAGQSVAQGEAGAQPGAGVKRTLGCHGDDPDVLELEASVALARGPGVELVERQGPGWKRDGCRHGHSISAGEEG